MAFNNVVTIRRCVERENSDQSHESQTGKRLPREEQDDDQAGRQNQSQSPRRSETTRVPGL